jgi:hypothetical protein
MICIASFLREIVEDHLIFRAALPSLSLYWIPLASAEKHVRYSEEYSLISISVTANEEEERRISVLSSFTFSKLQSF